MKPNLETLPIGLVIEILHFLDFKAWLFLSSTNKSFFKISQNSQWIVVRECINRYFSADIELFWFLKR